ncbi:hypothetical protein NVP1216O_68 [Vibrio phage 1.216.O._10N.222.55.C12]|nr:hypothetical protein NVP1135O_75 [Vibrio phage 1.135.O._10N.222.54.B6]AUR96196.1 hypothetical protein NVP1216O_68 [Vibrio phage 1.216.O._10N.222.55.C12]
MSSHIERMKVEHKELKEKCEALGAFIYGNEIFNGLCNLERARMIKQLGFMDAYLQVLESRIWVAIEK